MQLPRTCAQLDDLLSTPTEGVIEALRQCPGEIAVLGAAGKMGFHVSRMLQKAVRALDRSDKIRTVSRFSSPASRDKFEQAGFEVVAADLSDPDQVSNLAPAENVFFLAGMKFGTANDPDLLHQMNVVMPGLVADHFSESRIVALSTGCVYAFCKPESGGSTEDCPTAPPGEYAVSCLGREEAFRKSGAKTALIRLNYSIDLRYGVLVDIAQKVRTGQPVPVETGYVNVIWQGDAVAHTIQSLSFAESPPFLLNVTGPGVLRVRDLATAFGEKFGREPVFEGEEAPTAWLSNAAKSHNLFGEPPVSLETMIDLIARWLESGGELLDKPTHFENREGKY
ncbi:MAG: NAD(P)-dependent oxidoreductase [Verrucomicrobiales bacterium]|nr:NAD(P)-dependent oxidoreductase [Verrucomicrobiales bacterium]